MRLSGALRRWLTGDLGRQSWRKQQHELNVAFIQITKTRSDQRGDPNGDRPIGR